MIGNLAFLITREAGQDVIRSSIEIILAYYASDGYDSDGEPSSWRLILVYNGESILWGRCKYMREEVMTGLLESSGIEINGLAV